MNTHELMVTIDDTFTGSMSEGMKHFNFPPNARDKILRYSRSGKLYEGHKIKIVGIIKHFMQYGVLDEDGNMIHKGTANELSKVLYIAPMSIENAARETLNYKIGGKYKVIKLGMIDKIYEYKVGAHAKELIQK